MNPDEIQFIDSLEHIGIHLDEGTHQTLFTYLKQLLTANETTNLTAIKSYEEALVKHLLDSLLVSNHPGFIQATRILDVGSGAGLPGIPLAISHPEKSFDSLEATRKKIDFQKEVCKILHTTNHTAIWGRAEELGHLTVYRERYDLVLARALASMNTLAELTLPFVAMNGYAVFYKAKEFQNELDTATEAITTLGGALDSVCHFNLPSDSGERNLVIIKKCLPSPSQYPRRSGLPQKKPL